MKYLALALLLVAAMFTLVGCNQDPAVDEVSIVTLNECDVETEDCDSELPWRVEEKQAANPNGPDLVTCAEFTRTDDRGTTISSYYFALDQCDSSQQLPTTFCLNPDNVDDQYCYDIVVKNRRAEPTTKSGWFGPTANNGHERMPMPPNNIKRKPRQEK